VEDLAVEMMDELADWPTGDKIALLGRLRGEWWRTVARPEQIPPAGEWRVWYLMGGRGSGKSRTGAETFCDWVASHPAGEWAVIGPTFADARDTCVESSSSGILPILGPAVQEYNRSIGEIRLVSGTKIYLDGGDDGALRIQGKNLRGVWADEVGLWKKWDQAWNESIAFAVRHAPSKIVATGTPKMGHGLVRLLVEDTNIPVSQMHTKDNLANLDPGAVADLYRQYGNTRLGSQELDGEWLAEIEGDLLKRAWWKFYDPTLLGSTRNPGIKAAQLPKFSLILLSIDTPLKDKETSDFVALQAWGVIGADRYLLDSRVEHLSYDQCKRAVHEMSRHMRRSFKHSQHRVLIENAGYGIELFIDLKRELSGVTKVPVGPEGSKTMRALSASDDLEGGNVFVPGHGKADLSGIDEKRSPAMSVSLIDQAALFPNGQNDDQVDAFSQAMNWLRSKAPQPLRTSSANILRRSGDHGERRTNPFLRIRRST
jgi:predicted phage terminase large subunit-like protein